LYYGGIEPELTDGGSAATPGTRGPPRPAGVQLWL